MPSTPSYLDSQHWLSQIKAKTCIPEDLKLIQECSERLKGVASGNFSTFCKRELPDGNQLFTLLSNRWLSDEHINACCSYISEKLGPSSPVCLVNSFFLDKLARIRHDSSAFLPPGSRKLDADIESLSVRTLLIPVHLPDHWTVLIINILEQTYSYTDTLDLSECTAPLAMVANLEWWLSRLLEYSYKLKPVLRQFESDRQNDSISCGMAVMTTMSHIALSTPPWAQTRTSMLRIEWFITFTRLTSNSKVDGTGKVLEGAPNSYSGSTLASPSESTVSLHSVNLDSEPVCNDQGQSSRPPNTIPLLPSPWKPLKQATLNFPKVGKEEYRELERLRTLKRKAEDEALEEIEEKLNEEKLLKKKQKARDKKQRQREKTKAKLANEIPRKSASPCPIEPLTAPSATSDEANSLAPGPLLSSGVAEISRPHRQLKHILLGHNDKETPNEAKYVNWMNPILFNIINAAAIAVGYPWSPAEIVKRLQLQHLSLFDRLRPQRISDWKDSTVKDRLKWKDSVLKAVETGNRPGGTSTRQPLLAKYPDLVSIFRARLLGLCTTGAPLDTAYVRGFMIGTIAEHAPELFECKVSKDKPFRCTGEFVRSFLHNELNWSIRRPTRAAQKVPANVQEVLTKAFLRLACAIRDENIPSCCIVNSDQTQVVYSTGTQYTWHAQGDKQVPVLGRDEKRAFTLLVGVSNDGQLLPLQAIYQGLSEASLPQRRAPGYAEAVTNRVSFVCSMTATYWSTLQTMKDYVHLILVPFFRHMITTHHLPNDQRCIWQIDVWSVH
ncbi:Ulp1 protease family, carboxy-terminal catalytic domain protein [Rhizoctonia solani AG-3 Rhs1AP]|uniref:Ulp1 protease family, carboxy-terminal catalytic domain protein n=1 Tax=Rhizoctonia solani AG-3 Rhs1AP TaxID=1086054 RepID=X8JDD0_9AGAM|nr:Ulp1 protease family, carboxy-terminal catalytic domain protein [Rhizoctonia solani AG-3 Rhs1AP]